jgi:hypothetical protein
MSASERVARLALESDALREQVEELTAYQRASEVQAEANAISTRLDIAELQRCAECGGSGISEIGRLERANVGLRAEVAWVKRLLAQQDGGQ